MWLTLSMIILPVILIFAIASNGVAAEQSGREAADVVGQFQSVLLSVMKDADVLGFKGRLRRLEPAVKQSHDLPRVARLTIGRGWRSLNRQQKLRFIDTFTRLVVATYAHQFDAWSGESFHIRSVQPLRRGRWMVRTELIKSSGKRVHLDYVLYYRKGGWRMINIIADGVSDLALKRAEYSSVMGREGFDHLVALLESKIAQYH